MCFCSLVYSLFGWPATRSLGEGWCGRRDSLGNSCLRGNRDDFDAFHFQNLLVFEPSLFGFASTPQIQKYNRHKGRLYFWCGRRESNPRLKLGKLSCCHYTTPANLFVFYSTCWQMSIKIFLPLSACF